MSALDRRTVLKGAVVAGAAGALPLAAGAAAPTRTLLVFDSRVAESLAFARHLGAVHRLDQIGRAHV